MKNVRLLLFLSTVLAAGSLPAKEEVVALYEDHRVAIAVPDGYLYAKSFTETGLISIKITDPNKETSLEISLLPDPEGNFGKARARKEFMAENFEPYVADSVEKAMQFEELSLRSGSGTYCIFTDAALVGKTELPPNEYLNATTGVKAWPGCAAIFTLLSNGTKSKAYETALKIVTESFYDKARQATL